MGAGKVGMTGEDEQVVSAGEDAVLVGVAVTVAAGVVAAALVAMEEGAADELVAGQRGATASILETT